MGTQFCIQPLDSHQRQTVAQENQKNNKSEYGGDKMEGIPMKVVTKITTHMEVVTIIATIRMETLEMYV